MKRVLFRLVLVLSLIIIGVVSSDSIFMGMKSNRVITYSDLIYELKVMKYRIEEIKPSQDGVGTSFFSVIPKRIQTNGQGIIIYEFENSSTAKLEAQTISKDGNIVGNHFIEWADIPHYYQQGNLIIEYVGNNKKLLYDLKQVAGKPISNQ